MIRFSYPTKDLLRLLRQLKSPVSVSRYDAHFMRCELIVLPTKVIFKLPGNEVYIDIELNGSCKTFFFFKDVYDVLRKMKETNCQMIIDLKTIQLNDVTLSAQTQLLDKKAIKGYQEMPMEFLNAEAIDLFSQHRINTVAYTSKDNQRTYSESELMTDILQVYTRLKKYNIDYLLVDRFVRGNLIKVK